MSLDPSPYKNLHDMYDDDCDDEDEPVDDADATAMTQSCRRSKSMTSCDVSMIASHASNSGDVSDDDSESVLSDKRKECCGLYSCPLYFCPLYFSVCIFVVCIFVVCFQDFSA